MDYLKDFKITDEVINYLESILDEEEKKAFEDNIYFVYKSIKYFQTIGVTTATINKMFLKDYTIFYEGDINLRNKASKLPNLKQFVDNLNMNIDLMTYFKKRAN